MYYKFTAMNKSILILQKLSKYILQNSFNHIYKVAELHIMTKSISTLKFNE